MPGDSDSAKSLQLRNDETFFGGLGRGLGLLVTVCKQRGSHEILELEWFMTRIVEGIEGNQALRPLVTYSYLWPEA